MSEPVTYYHSESFATSINVEEITQQTIRISFRTSERNRPTAFGNYLAIWEVYDSAVPADVSPLQTFPITGDETIGSCVFAGLKTIKTSYVIGYATGPALGEGAAQMHGNICASVYIPAGSRQVDAFVPGVNVLAISSDFLVIHYELPDGVRPQDNGACIGVWKGSVPSFGRAPDFVFPVPSNATNARVSCRIDLIRGGTYVAALFTSGYKAGERKPLTTMAAWANFNT